MVDEYIVFDRVAVLTLRSSAQEERGIERLSIMPGKVVLDSPVKILEIRRVSSPLQVVTKLVCKCIPRFLSPVHPLLQPCQGCERTMVHDYLALQALHTTPDLHRQRDALARA